MFNNTAVNIFIGFSLIFLLYSLLATTVQEIIAKWLGLRNRMLVKAVRRMLNDETSVWWLKRIKLFTFVRECLIGFIRLFAPYFLDDRSFVKAFFEAPSIKYLAESTWNSKPSYIAPSTFSQTIVNLLRGNDTTPSSNQMGLIRNKLYTMDNKPEDEKKHKGPKKSTPDGSPKPKLEGKKDAAGKNPDTKPSLKERFTDSIHGLLQSIIYNTYGSQRNDDFIIKGETLTTLRNFHTDSGGDIEKFKAQLENWFQETMQRASGWYKKQTGVILFMIGLGMAWYYNIDAVNMYHILSTDKATQEQLVNIAIQNKDQLGKIITAIPDPTPPKRTASKPNVIQSPTLSQSVKTDTILLHNYKSLQKQADQINNLMGLGYNSKRDWRDPDTWSIGFFITALAVSLGANFWFDLLSKLIALRAAGPKPSNSNDQSNSSSPSNNQTPVKTVG